MKNNKGISLISVIIAILLMAILVVLIWVGIVIKNSGDDNKNKDNSSNIAVKNDNENSLLSMDLDDLVYDAEYDKADTNIGEITYYPKALKNDIWVVDYDNPVIIKLSDIQYPYIDLDSSDAQKANNEIKDMYKQYKDSFDNYSKENMNEVPTPYFIDAIMEEDFNKYSKYRYENIISVVIYDIANSNSDNSNEWLYDYSTWTFNLENQKLMDFEEICEKLGYNENEVRQQVENQVKNKLLEYSDFNDEWNIYHALDNTMENYDNSKKYFIDNAGNLNIIVDTEVPFEREHYEFIYTIK